MIGIEQLKLCTEDITFINNVKKFSYEIEKEILNLTSRYFDDNFINQHVKKMTRNIQEKIFKKTFLDIYIRNILYEDTINSDLKKENLVMGQCNFPAKETLRSKDRNTEAIPCRRRVPQGYYFCKLDKHMKYAKLANLPLYEEEPERIVYKRQKLEMESTIEMEVEYPENNHSSINSCCYECVFTGNQCSNIGEYADKEYPDLYYCKEHTRVTDHMISMCTNDEMRNDFLRIQEIDSIKVEHQYNNERIYLASKYGLGSMI